MEAQTKPMPIRVVWATPDDIAVPVDEDGTDSTRRHDIEVEWLLSLLDEEGRQRLAEIAAR